MAAPPPPKEIAPEEDKVAQVMRIIKNLELQKSNISPAQANKVVEKIVAAPEAIEKETIVDTILQAEPDIKSTVSVEDKQAIEAIVEAARTQNAAVDDIVKESTAEHLNEEAASQDKEVKLVEEIKLGKFKKAVFGGLLKPMKGQIDSFHAVSKEQITKKCQIAYRH